MNQQVIREFIGHVTYFVVLVRSRLAWASPLYWRTQYRRLAAASRAAQQWEHQQYEKAVQNYEVRLAKESTNRECAVRCYEALLADREKQITELAANLREARSELEELRALSGTLPVHPTVDQATKALACGEISFNDYLQLDFAN